MTTHWAGITVSGTSANFVRATLGGGQLVIQGDDDFSLEVGERAAALSRFFDRVCDMIKTSGIKHVVIKASAVSSQRATDALLSSAELRGVVIAACAKAGASVVLQKRASLSRDKSKRKLDTYLDDEAFWSAKLGVSGSSKGQLRKGSREAAFLILAQEKG